MGTGRITTDGEWTRLTDRAGGGRAQQPQGGRFAVIWSRRIGVFRREAIADADDGQARFAGDPVRRSSCMSWSPNVHPPP